VTWLDSAGIFTRGQQVAHPTSEREIKKPRNCEAFCWFLLQLQSGKITVKNLASDGR
jgi:hypothetical protein